MIDINTLAPLSELQDIEQSFKAFAGPGAGKTTWLISHLKRILRSSARLGITRKVACITYTNIAVEQLISKLDIDQSNIEITTIHGFLYANVICPFAHLIEKDDQGQDLFNIAFMQGHEEHQPYGDKIRAWIKSIEKQNVKRYGYLNDVKVKTKLLKYLTSLDFRINKIGQAELYAKKFYSELLVPSSHGELWMYKKKFWSEGIMHHEDVLYFAHLIFQRSPRVLEFISNRFPYMLVDEFQDTTSMQTEIVKKIGQTATVIGIIGDIAQSIYKFAGSVRNDFEDFDLPGMLSYKMDKNFRSTQSIIDFLNLIRKDIHQEGYEETLAGLPVNILVGTERECYQWGMRNIGKNIVFLAETHEILQTIMKDIALKGSDLLEQLLSEESDSNRGRYILSILRGSNLLERKQIKQAVRSIASHLRKRNPQAGQFNIQKAAIHLLEQLKNPLIRKMSIHDFYVMSNNQLEGLFGLKSFAKLTAGGKATNYYFQSTIDCLLPFVRVDSNSEDKIRTIHSAKGAEFNDVMVWVESLKSLDQYIFDASTLLHGSVDNARKYYVAFSRVKKNLYICVPEMKPDIQKKLEGEGLKIEFMRSSPTIEKPRTLFDFD